MNYYDEIKKNLIKCEIYDKSKDFAKNKYGKNIIKQYSEKLMIEVGKKYNE